MEKLEKIKNVLLPLMMAVFCLCFLKSFACGRVQIDEKPSEGVLTITFNDPKNFFDFLDEMECIGFEFKQNQSKDMRLSILHLCRYDFLVSEIENLFYNKISDIIGDDREDLIKKVCRSFSKIVIGKPIPFVEAGSKAIRLDYGVLAKNLEDVIMKKLSKLKDAIFEGRDVLPITILLGPDTIVI